MQTDDTDAATNKKVAPTAKKEMKSPFKQHLSFHPQNMSGYIGMDAIDAIVKTGDITNAIFEAIRDSTAGIPITRAAIACIATWFDIYRATKVEGINEIDDETELQPGELLQAVSSRAYRYPSLPIQQGATFEGDGNIPIQAIVISALTCEMLAGKPFHETYSSTGTQIGGVLILTLPEDIKEAVDMAAVLVAKAYIRPGLTIPDFLGIGMPGRIWGLKPMVYADENHNRESVEESTLESNVMESNVGGGITE